jgi:pimeloyl-ACP methyl ester carboxylesterase
MRHQYNYCMLQLAIVLGFVLLSISVAVALIVRHAANRLSRPARRLAGGTPADYDLPYEGVSFPTSDGIILRGWWIEAAPLRGTLVFCHGHGGSKAPDLKYVPWLRDHGYSVLLFDFRAHGDSEGVSTALVCHGQHDLLAAVAYLERRGIHQLGLMGFSMGAAVAIAAAPLSQAVRAVVADSPFAELRTIVRVGMCRRGLPQAIASPLTELVLKSLARRTGCTPSDSDPIRWVNDISPRPVLIIHGGRDLDVPASEARRLYERARTPKELWVVDQAAHRCVDQVCPDEYRSRILAFFDQWL